MAQKKQVQAKTNTAKQAQTKPVNGKQITPAGDLLSKMDAFFDKHTKVIFWISLVLTALFSFLLFTLRVSEGGDDSTYIVRALELVKQFKYPSFQGPLYPLVLSPFIALFGIKLPLLKFLSLLFMVLHLIFFYKSFKSRISSLVLVTTLLIISANSYILYFASQTYSEAFFMFLQSMLFYFFFEYFVAPAQKDYSLKASYKQYLVVGLMLFLLSSARSVGTAAITAIILFLAIDKKWKALLWNFVSFASFMALFELLKRMLWGASGAQFKAQASDLMLKDYYDPTQGYEDFWGFIQRFIDNSHQYLSKHFFTVIGLRPEGTTEISVPLTILAFTLFFITLILIFRKNKYLLFTGIYTAIMCTVSFLILQKSWDQSRLIIIFCPLIFLFLLAGIYELFKLKKLKFFQFILPIFCVILFFINFKTTSEHASQNMPVLRKNMSGNITYGFTPDWVNYIKMSKWVEKNIPDSLVVAARKATVSTIYANGRYFFGVYKFPVSNADTAILNLQKHNAKVCIIAINEWQNKNISNPEMLQVMSHNVGMIPFKNSLSIIYEYTSADSIILFGILKKYNISYQNDIAAFHKTLKESKEEYSLVDADYIMNYLKSNKVRYLILASLRRNPHENTGYIIDTMHRFLYFLQFKYPNAFKQVHQIGNDDEEPAVLWELNY